MKYILNRILRYKDRKKTINIFITLFGALLYTIGIKWFIIPAQLKTGGFTGIAQLLLGFFKHNLNINISNNIGVSILWFILNIPVFFLGFKHVGRRFTVLSFISVIFGTIALAVLPMGPVDISNDHMLSAITGGVITGIGIGFTLKVGASTGGMDIISQYLSLKREGSFGKYSFILNVFIVAIVGFTDSWELALYTIITLFIVILVVDKIHTRHNKLTLMIVTSSKDELVDALHKRVYRGITVLPAMGAYSKQDKSILLMVVSSYELYNVIATIREIDGSAFTDVIRSQGVFGNFAKQKLD